MSGDAVGVSEHAFDQLGLSHSCCEPLIRRIWRIAISDLTPYPIPNDFKKLGPVVLQWCSDLNLDPSAIQLEDDVHRAIPIAGLLPAINQTRSRPRRCERLALLILLRSAAGDDNAHPGDIVHLPERHRRRSAQLLDGRTSGFQSSRHE